jgi:alpha-ketoglutarate-dependent taurine dioxygenase
MKFISDNPLLPGNESAYQRWREKKLADITTDITDLQVAIQNPAQLSVEEIQRISTHIEQNNLAIFCLTDPLGFSATDLKSLGAQLGLHRLDSNLYANEADISELRVIDTGRRGEYIPYTNRALSWHTDGYYNHLDHSIRTFMLYCVSDAPHGGSNQLIDPELIYIALRDENPAFITALMQSDVLTIPETVEEGQLIRPRQQSAVFSIDPQSNALLTRYTQRKTFIQWKNGPITQAALTYLGELLSSEATPILKHRLQPGEGLICNNVLHNRSAFEDSEDHQRLMYRARYYDCIGDKQT